MVQRRSLSLRGVVVLRVGHVVRRGLRRRWRRRPLAASIAPVIPRRTFHLGRRDVLVLRLVVLAHVAVDIHVGSDLADVHVGRRDRPLGRVGGRLHVGRRSVRRRARSAPLRRVGRHVALAARQAIQARHGRWLRRAR